MALWGAARQAHNRRGWDLRRIWRRALMVPEALALLVLLGLGIVFGIQPLLAVLVLLVAGMFAARLGLLYAAERSLARGDYAGSRRLLDVALRLNPWSSDTLMLRAHSLSLQGNDEDAERELRRALALDPDDDTVRGALAATLLAQGRYREGRQLATVAGFDAASPLGVQQRAWLALHVDQDPERALGLLAACDEQHFAPHLALPLLVTRCETLLALNDRPAAEQTLELLSSRLELCPLPQQAELLYHAGRLKTQLGLEAAADFRRSVELDPAGRWAQAAWRGAIGS